MTNIQMPEFISIVWACTPSHFERAQKAATQTRGRFPHAMDIFKMALKPFSLPRLYNCALDEAIRIYPEASHYAIISADIVIEELPKNLSNTRVTFGVTRNYNGNADYTTSSVRIIPRRLRHIARLNDDFKGLFWEDLDLRYNVLNDDQVTSSEDFKTYHLYHEAEPRKEGAAGERYLHNKQLFEKRYFEKYGRNWA